MSQSTATVLAPKTILQAISQLELPGTTLQRLFGWGFDGGNRLRQSGRNFAYDVIDHSRSVATARVPGQPATRRSPQKVRTTSGVFPRSAETISLLDEDLLNRRRIGGQLDELDEHGESYLTRQEAYLGQRFANLIEFQTAAMIRGRFFRSKIPATNCITALPAARNWSISSRRKGIAANSICSMKARSSTPTGRPPRPISHCTCRTSTQPWSA